MKNSVYSEIPIHLRQYIVDQCYDKYNWRDHAVWRYVMNRNLEYLPKVAHESYVEGLKKTGISINKIPALDEMNEILGKIGWKAVCVSGFIPPEAFMEFQANRILVIAADIRHLKHIKYTPAPDILHEAAGHAPIIANQEYAKYLEEFGKVGAKAFSSAKDHEIYTLIRELSILKALADADETRVQELEDQLAILAASGGHPSEMSLLRNLHWWTVEYGLIGTIENPLIYGAGLLSSIGESVSAMKAEIIKIPYSIEASHFNFDITKMQPQLFVTPDFKYLNTVLNEFSSQMAFSNGGAEGILKAIESKHTATCELSSGLLISGIFTEAVLQGPALVYIKTSGPTALGYKGQMLLNHGKDYHSDGYGTAVGVLQNSNKPIRFLSDEDLKELNIIQGQLSELEFVSGLKVSGVLKSILRKKGHILLMSFEQCTVVYEDQTFFKPEWGVFDMGVGEQLISAYNGCFSPTIELEDSIGGHYQRIINPVSSKLDQYYKQIRDCREQDLPLPNVKSILKDLELIDNKDWLLPYEILELSKKREDVENKNIILRHIKNLPEDQHHYFL